ncbi:MAG: DUF2993 domain-containing protein [Chthonomonadales bacterium]
MQILFHDLTIAAKSMDLGPVTLEDVSFKVANLTLDVNGHPQVQFGTATAKLSISENRLNALLQEAPPEKIKNLDIKTYAGRVSISGKQALVGGIYMPFTLNARPEIESGVRLRLNLTEFHVVKSLSLPSALVHYIGEKLNQKLGESFDSSRFEVPVRLLSVEAEPGRLLITAEIKGECQEEIKLLDGAIEPEIVN